MVIVVLKMTVIMMMLIINLTFELHTVSLAGNTPLLTPYLVPLLD